jgi:hypothetical protein
VQSGCDERLRVELYALEQGWTVFARFSEFAREEKVDRVLLDEFGALADRLARALLADISVQETLDREKVLRADSEAHIRRVRGQPHFQLAAGTALRVGRLVSLGVGVSHQRFDGPRRDEVGVRGTSASTGLHFAPRIGVELFRTTDTRLALYAEAGIPAFSAADPLTPVVRAFTPSTGVGAGVSF